MAINNLNKEKDINGNKIEEPEIKDEILSYYHQNILFNLNKFNENLIKKLSGTRGFEDANLMTGYKVVILGSNKNILNLKMIFDEKEYNIQIDFKNIHRSKCDCIGIDLQYLKYLCPHIVASLLYLKRNIKELVNFFHDESLHKKKIALSKEEIKRKQEERERRKQNIESLKLEPERVEDALEDVENFLITLHTQGLQRLSSITLEWANQLFIKTQIAKLANINKQLKIISELINKYLNRSPLFEIAEYKAVINNLTNYYLLTKNLLEGKKINHPDVNPEVIIGKFRSEYIEHGDIAAQCLGMKGWISKDEKFIGISGYFLNLKKLSLFSITQALPTYYFGDNPSSIYHNTIKSIDESMADLAHGAFYFSNVKFNDKGNLSLHKELEIKKIRLRLLKDLEEFHKFRINNWLDLINILCNREIHPIPMPYELNNYYVLEPASWGKFEFDPIGQEYKSIIADANQKTIVLRVENKPFNRKIIKNLQLIYKNKDLIPNALFGIISVKDSLISVWPISLFYYQGIGYKKRSYYSQTEIKLIGEFHLNLEYAENLTLI
ncbi:MAG: SWIM zinc finger family protein [Promethearchaeota archaeon]